METSQVQTKLLREESAPGEFKLYRAALEWDLIDPIVIENQKDIKSHHRWQERIEPFRHQVTNLMTFCRRLPVTLLADDVGLGKTISAGLVISELAVRSRLEKALVVAPKLLGPQWKEELETKFKIPAKIAIGKDLKTADFKDMGVVITTYNSARLYLDKIPADRFQMLILDEAHKLRNLYGTEKPPKVALEFKKALAERRFRYVLMLTATPLQNRLWDLYSLVDLLSVARGHDNPFGSEGIFARRFIADDREKARRLKPETKSEFQSIVYGYMSRVRRGDAQLYFPERVVHMERVHPSLGELELIDAISEPIQALNRLTQISILQALTSSPEALSAQLQNMAQKGSVPRELAWKVREIVARMPTTAKLNGLGALVHRLRMEDPEKWRLVVFTTRRETQTTIEEFLSRIGLKVGIINGSTSGRNSETIRNFRADPPKLNVIVSTEAGSEGVNLQVANVLVNYDLPWNPMIVEQRIGRVQRLASQYANVSIFNIMLKGTFEEYIVGRLMEKLQLASHAIGDIESLLEASGIGDGDEGSGFDEILRQLILAALAGKDVERERRLAEDSIDAAKVELERERREIDSLLGNMEGSGETGPRAPRLPPAVHSMDAKEFVLQSYQYLGASVVPVGTDHFFVEHDGVRQEIILSATASSSPRAVLYEPGSAAFSRLVTRVANSGIHKVKDSGRDIGTTFQKSIEQWTEKVGVGIRQVVVNSVQRSFGGTALVKVRCLVQHDSYECLVDVPCEPSDHTKRGDRSYLSRCPPLVEDISTVGISKDVIKLAAESDPAISEFRRFYLERREVEERAAGADERKRHKLREDFTPRLEMIVVGLEGDIGRRIDAEVTYVVDGAHEYAEAVAFDAQSGQLREPELRRCEISGRMVPTSSLEVCTVTNLEIMRHRLGRSEVSGLYAQPQFLARCAISGKRVLADETERSAVTGAVVYRELLKTSALSGKKAEPSHIKRCEFSHIEALSTETSISEISGKCYRSDSVAVSSFSGKSGHRSEFTTCYETLQTLAIGEAERCQATGYLVRPGILVKCAITNQRVLPKMLQVCSATNKAVLRDLLVASSVSQRWLLRSVAVVSGYSGRYCAVTETAACSWSSRRAHPDDIVECKLTGLAIHREFSSGKEGFALNAMVDLLHGRLNGSDRADIWPLAVERLERTVRGKIRPEAAILSANQQLLAICCEIRNFLGFRSRRLGLVFSLKNQAIVGKIVDQSVRG